MQNLKMNKKKIIYIAGYGRSGSSILALTLGQHKKIISLGEIGVIFSALKNKRICTCGQKLETCSYWKQLIEENKYKKNSNRFLNKLENPYLNVNWLCLKYLKLRVKSKNVPQLHDPECSKILNILFQFFFLLKPRVLLKYA